MTKRAPAQGGGFKSVRIPGFAVAVFFVRVHKHLAKPRIGRIQSEDMGCEYDSFLPDRNPELNS